MLDRISHIIELIKDDPDDPFLPYALALEYIKKGNHVEADSIFKTIIHQFPKYLPVYYHAAQLKIQMASPKEAIPLIESGKKLASEQRDMKTFNELTNLLLEIDDD